MVDSYRFLELIIPSFCFVICALCFIDISVYLSSCKLLQELNFVFMKETDIRDTIFDHRKTCQSKSKRKS